MNVKILRPTHLHCLLMSVGVLTLPVNVTGTVGDIWKGTCFMNSEHIR